MNYIQVMALIQFKTGKLIGISEIASKLDKSRQYIDKIKHHEVSLEHLEQLEKIYGYSLKNRISNADAVEVVYYENPKLKNIIRNKKVTSVWRDREITHDIWEEDEHTLRAIRMPGDSMDGGTYSIKNNDVLIIDTKDTDTLASGVFAYTTQNDSLLFVSDIKKRMDGSLKFTFWNKDRYPEVTHSPESLAAMNFKVIGRVIHNESKKSILG